MQLSDVGAQAKKWAIRIAYSAVLAIVVAAAVYTVVTLKFSYAQGEHVGFVQKLAKSGWLCKTNEGTLATVNVAGQPAQMFQFTVRDDDVVKQIEALSGHRVVLEYEEHKGIPSTCFGDTQYFVTGVREAK